ncbi:hypothetical protein A2U01_0074255, partial [Trifolium medium]|nr:hypothetical protein [Trifolium medium]
EEYNCGRAGKFFTGIKTGWFAAAVKF